MRPSYTERAIGPLAVLWHRTVGAEPEHTRILPDGCLDLLWDGSRLVVAGPDAAARWHDSAPGTRYVGLRLFGGLGAVAVGVPAVELLGRSVGVEELLPAQEARALAVRLQDALTRIQAGTPLAEVAAVSGYADQPHLTREVCTLTGTTPASLVR